MSLLGSVLSVLLGKRMGRRVRGPSTAACAKRIGIYWLLLVFYGTAAGRKVFQEHVAALESVLKGK